MTGSSDRVVVYRGEDGRFYWHYQSAGNFRILADSGQSYSRRTDAIAGARRVTHCALVPPDHADVGLSWVLPLYVLGGRP